MFDPETQGVPARAAVACSWPRSAPTASRTRPVAGAWTSLELGPPAVVRLLLDADDERTLEHVAAGGAIAITAANVLTLRSLQLKGRAQGLDAASPDDPERVERYVRAVPRRRRGHRSSALGDLPAVLPRGRTWPASSSVDEMFDQTPGPGRRRADGVALMAEHGSRVLDVQLSQLERCFGGAIPAVIATAAGRRHAEHHVPVAGAPGRRRARGAVEPVLLEDRAEPRREPAGERAADGSGDLRPVPADASSTSARSGAGRCSSGCAATSTPSPRSAG